MFKKNVAVSIPFCLVSAADGSALTGATVTARRSLDGGPQAAATGAVTELANGQYKFAAAAGDMNGDTVGLLFTATGAVPIHFTIKTDAKLVSDLNDFAGGAVASVTDRTGFKLASDGLDSIAVTVPTGVAATFPQMVVQLWRRFFGKATKSPTEIKTYAADGATVLTTQAIADDGAGNETQGAAT